jgi:hypothetical protein
MTPEDIAAALRALEEAGPVAVAYHGRYQWPDAPKTRWQRLRGMGAGWFVLYALFGAIDLVLGAGRKRRERRQPLGDGEGVVDLARRRAALDFGGWAVLEKDEHSWRGRSGRALSTLPVSPRNAHDALWLLDILRGAVSATEVDLGRAVTALGVDLPLPSGRTYNELSALPVDVTLDAEGALRSVRYAHPHVEATLEILVEPPPAIDWERLPSLVGG